MTAFNPIPVMCVESLEHLTGGGVNNSAVGKHTVTVHKHKGDFGKIYFSVVFHLRFTLQI
jgi:hypothetical protein